MSLSNLKKWPHFGPLEPEFITNIHLAFVFGIQGNQVLIVTKDDMVYALDINSNGCLGTGDTQSTLHPEKVEVLCQKGVKTFAFSGEPHLLALTNKGEIYSLTHNGDFKMEMKLLSNGMASIVAQPLGGSIVVGIACANHYSLALTEQGEVFAWGKSWIYSSIPEKIDHAIADKKIVSIACGTSFSMAVTEHGEVYGWGANNVGQLGLGNYTSQYKPSKVTALDSIFIEKVVCGYDHILALSDKGALYVWGRNCHGQLGLGHTENAHRPVKVSVAEMGRVYDIAAVNVNHISVAMGHGNCVYVWGECGGQSITRPLRTDLAHPHDALAFYANPSGMHQPLLLHAEQEDTIGRSLLDCLKNAFDDGSTSDLIIQVQGKPIHVHKSVLKIRSQNFRSMFQEHWTENSQSTLQLDQFSHAIYKSYLRYLYTDDVDVPAEEASELLELADAYCDSEFKKRCVKLIKHGITVENAASFYGSAMKYNAKDLEEFCFEFALNHMPAVVQTTNFANLDESTFKTFVIKAAQAGVFKTVKTFTELRISDSSRTKNTFVANSNYNCDS